LNYVVTDAAQSQNNVVFVPIHELESTGSLLIFTVFGKGNMDVICHRRTRSATKRVQLGKNLLA